MILVEEGKANVETKNEDSLWTPLHSAAYLNYLDIVKFLVEEAGADVSAKTRNGKYTAKTLALSNSSVFQYLRDA